MEDSDEPAYLLLVISDEEGKVVRKIKQSAKKGLHRVNWNGRHEVTSPVSFRVPNPDNPYDEADQGPLALPGKYTVHLVKVANGTLEELTDKTPFVLSTLNNSTLSVNKKELDSFNRELAEFRRVVLGTNEYCKNVKERVRYMKASVLQTDAVSAEMIRETKELDSLLVILDLALNGDRSLAKREFETLSGMIGQVEGIVGSLWSTTAQQPDSYIERLAQCKKSFRKIHEDAKLLKNKTESLERKLESIKAPYTPGRLPEFKDK
jgi:hypothetical protein